MADDQGARSSPEISLPIRVIRGGKIVYHVGSLADLATLAERMLRRATSVARLKELEATGTRLDSALWQELREAGLTAVGLGPAGPASPWPYPGP